MPCNVLVCGWLCGVLFADIQWDNCCWFLLNRHILWFRGMGCFGFVIIGAVCVRDFGKCG